MKITVPKVEGFGQDITFTVGNVTNEPLSWILPEKSVLEGAEPGCQPAITKETIGGTLAPGQVQTGTVGWDCGDLHAHVASHVRFSGFELDVPYDYADTQSGLWHDVVDYWESKVPDDQKKRNSDGSFVVLERTPEELSMATQMEGLQAEIDRLRAQNENDKDQVQRRREQSENENLKELIDFQNQVHQTQMENLQAEIDRLRAEQENSPNLVGKFIGWFNSKFSKKK